MLFALPKESEINRDELHGAISFAETVQKPKAAPAGAALFAAGALNQAVPAFTFNRQACSNGSVYPLGWLRPLKTKSQAAL